MSLTFVILFDNWHELDICHLVCSVKSNIVIATKTKSDDFTSRVIENRYGDDNSDTFHKNNKLIKVVCPL